MTNIKYYAHAMAVDPETGKPMPKMMAIQKDEMNFVGYSTDVKPTQNIQKGASFLELDGTKDVYIYDGEKWVLF